ncbi:putative cyclin-dependent kinase 9 [Psilocybe cubensis]|uniref:Cyclin-dependent kinase 9 n=2 Tax=Psilocybe cubensis TaxID=181762 RepID=A0ACB8GQ21_PSICU|nr:putative cyclin-dependent kinase 9 [Psilocybe cubensis]KAH9477512.1 putative cyclin-dependent kinase 9 [Psilocybe cubensis]
MVSPQSRKRPASRSPEPARYGKRTITSSPEEGEVDDNPPPVTKPIIQPISLPQKPATTSSKNIPFPFKKKTDAPRNGAGGVTGDSQGKPLNVFEALEEKQAKKKDDMFKQNPRHNARQNGDHWEPNLTVQPGSLLSRMAPLPGGSHFAAPRDNGRDHRDRSRRSPSHYSPPRRRSPSPQHRDTRHRPVETSNFSPLNNPRERSRERGRYDRGSRSKSRSRSRSRDDYARRDDYSRRYRDDRHHYRGEHRQDSRAWTHRGDTYQDRRGYNERRYDNRHATDTYRPVSPRAPSPGPSRSAQPSPPPPPSSPPPPPPPASRPSVSNPPPPPPAPSLPPPPPPSDTPVPPSCPPPAPPPPPVDDGPRPPSSSPPPAPPPDMRLKDRPMPYAKPAIQRPDAPSDRHSPPPLNVPSGSTAKAMARGPDRRDTSTSQTQRKEQGEVTERPKEPERPKVALIKRRNVMRRPGKLEVQAYGHGFAGCGQQSDYEATTKLGEGTFGEVHKAIQKSTGVVVALKRILMHNEKEGMPVTALREIKILKALKHPSIISILDMFVVRSSDKDPLSVYMVFPYMDHDLAGLLENERVKLQPSHIKLYMKQLLEGTEYMHRNHILHRDMKAANLLISNDGTLRIADFGLARSFHSGASNPLPSSSSSAADGSGHRSRERKYTNCVVTRWYRPPELLLGARHYGGEVDIWGIGCVLGEMFTRRPILPGTSDLDQLEKIWNLCGAPNQHNWPNYDLLPGCEGVTRFNSQPRRLRQTYESVGPETVDLLDKLLMLNPKGRLTAAQALEHDYFWTDPLPADPKTLPTYEASHEFDKRGHRNHQPIHQGPPPGILHPNQQRPPGNPPFNRNGPPRGFPPPQQQQPFGGPGGVGVGGPGGGGGGMDRRGNRPPYGSNMPHPTYDQIHGLKFAAHGHGQSHGQHHNYHQPPPPGDTRLNNFVSAYNRGAGGANANANVNRPGGGMGMGNAPHPMYPGGGPGGVPPPPFALPRHPMAGPGSMPMAVPPGFGPPPGQGARGPGPGQGQRREWTSRGGGGGGGGGKLPLNPGLPPKPVGGPVSGGVAMGIPNRDRDGGRDYDRNRAPPPPPSSSGDALNYG